MKNILVSSASRGIGEATSRFLVQKGYFVYGVYNTNKVEAEKLIEELKNIKMFQYDFSDRRNTKLLKSLAKMLDSDAKREDVDIEPRDIEYS
ncbi:MAG: short chain dehydrogenase [Candidatus Parcubacteria bacterium]|jgi:NAD(P)-dependent dehydrogenase (short-subunit alcohol dehydrogenase family)